MSDLLLDANFLVLPFQFNVEIFDEFERLVGVGYQAHTLDRTLNEALNLDDQEYHALVSKLIDVKDINVINCPADKPVDDMLIDFARDGFIICTNDKDVRKQLDEEQLPHIYLRQQNHLKARHIHPLS